MLRHVSRSSFPARDRAMILLSIKAGLRACEIAGLDWSMVLDAQGRVSGTINVRDVIAKKRGGRRIPMHPDLRCALEHLAADDGARWARHPLLSRIASEGEQRGQLVRRALQGIGLRRVLIPFRSAQFHYRGGQEYPSLGLQPARRAPARGPSVHRNHRALHRRRHLRSANIGWLRIVAKPPGPRFRCGASGSQTRASIEHHGALPSQNGNPPPSPLSPRTIPCRSTPFLPKAELWSPKATKPAEPPSARRPAPAPSPFPQSAPSPARFAIRSFTAIERRKAAYEAALALSLLLTT
jgi:hypothetical protein